MADLPLLLLPSPTEVETQRRSGGPTTLKIPSPRRQVERLGPKFVTLQEAFEQRRAYLSTDVTGLIPEQVLVLETVGRVEDFFRAVGRVEGLAWLAEWDEDEMPPDDEFFRPKDREAALKGRVYLVMSNQQGMRELRSLWRLFQEDPEAPDLRHGLARWRDVFQRLRDIRPWGAIDRIRETGLLEDWQERVEHDVEEARVEIELWCRASADARRRSGRRVEALVHEEGGRVLGQAILAEISYHALLAELPITAVGRIVDRVEGGLVRADQVMLFRPGGQAGVGFLTTHDVSSAREERGVPTEMSGDPIVAVLDGLPMENHTRLRGRVVIDDPDGWAGDYPAEERQHGTAITSLVLHGDGLSVSATRPVYVRPILRPDERDFRSPRQEAVPSRELPVDLVHRAVRRIVAGEDGEDPVAESVRIINLSIGDTYRQYASYPSPWARLIDYLSWKYGILFIISAGNHPQDIQLEVPSAEVANLQRRPEDLEAAVVKAVLAEGWNRRLRPPAEAINALTVGAAHCDASGPHELRSRINPLVATALPNVISAIGPGFRRSIKPELLAPGGRQLVTEKFGNSESATLTVGDWWLGPGVEVAVPGREGEMDAVAHWCGTSLAAALTTRVAGAAYEVVLRLWEDAGLQQDDEQIVPIVKALATHCVTSSPDGVFERLNQETTTRLCGYGFLPADAEPGSDDHKATMVGFGLIEAKEGQRFRIPIPPSLSGQTVQRRITITLAWLSPVNPRHRAYRRAHLWFTPYGKTRGDHDVREVLKVDRCGPHWQAVKRGTLQHEVFEGEQAVSILEDDEFHIQINCASDAGDLEGPVRFGLVVSVETAPAAGIPVFQEIRARLPVGVRVGTAGAAP